MVHRSKTPVHYFRKLTNACTLAILGAGTAMAGAQDRAQAQPPATAPPATIVYRCETPNGDIHFADTPCRNQPSQKLRIEHYTVFSTPMDPRSVARLADISSRLERDRKARLSKKQAERDRRTRAAQQTSANCDAARAGLVRLRLRKKSGYPLRDAQALETQEQSLQRQVQTNCD